MPRLILLLASCDCPAQRQSSGERGPGSFLGCEKCHQFGWQKPRADQDVQNTVQEVCECAKRLLTHM